MTRYDAILLFILLLLVALGGYFIYRETTDPILFPGGDKEATATQAEAEGKTTTAPEPDERDGGESLPSADAESDVGAPPSGTVQKSFEEEISGQFGQLAALMETHLSSFVGAMQEQTDQQASKLETASRIVQEALSTYEADTRESLSGLSDTLNLIDEMRAESEAITSGLKEAREGWNQLFDDVTAIGNRTEDRLSEANFEFQTYTVEGAETLSEIARKLETSYGLPESDMTYLLNRFNDIEYRYFIPGGRRSPYRVVANQSLRVPITKSAGEILGEYALPEKLRSQVSSINQAATANTNLRNNLSRQVDKLKQLEANMNAIESVSASLAQLDLSTDEPMAEEESLSPELRQAWLEFEAVAHAYRAASGSEEEKLAQERLKGAITRLLGQYEKDYLKDAEAPDDPVDFYLRFIEKYRPGALSNSP